MLVKLVAYYYIRHRSKLLFAPEPATAVIIDYSPLPTKEPIMKYKRYIPLLFFFFVSCGSYDKTITGKDIIGNWLVVSSEPQFDETIMIQKEDYQSLKDSLIGPRGLKLISIMDKGLFRQVDSSYALPGSWLFNEKTRQIFVNNAGPGFKSFSGYVQGCYKDTMSIVETLNLPIHPMTVIWHFKKITESPEADLFAPANNQWRIKPNHPEDDAALRKKVSDMFHYYAVYFTMVSREASYFVPRRVLLPVKYYQHGVGMRDYATADNFKALFYNDEDARKAYDIVEHAVRIEKKYPSGKDYVDEYALYFGQLEKALK